MDVMCLGEDNSLGNTIGRKGIQERAGQKLKGGCHQARSAFFFESLFSV